MRACNCARASPFQSRTCEGCDPQLSIRQTMRISFNPCIRVGCDFRTRGEDGTSVPVSIHAPAWGATQALLRVLHLLLVSIHAPAWGATDSGAASLSTLHCFNPRTRVGCDFCCAGGLMGGRGFNPRTRVGCDGRPARPFSLEDICFNPRTRVGCDFAFFAGLIAPNTFQSTHPRGVRQELLYNSHCLIGFNPRTRVGCDKSWQDTAQRTRVSIHAPAWGATKSKIEKYMILMFQSTHPRGVRRGIPVKHRRSSLVSIHAPAWGATCHAVQGDAGRAVSIHAPAWGATCVRPWPWPRTAVSIHAPAWGATKILQYPANRQRVSIHAPAWGATSF